MHLVYLRTGEGVLLEIYSTFICLSPTEWMFKLIHIVWFIINYTNNHCTVLETDNFLNIFSSTFIVFKIN